MKHLILTSTLLTASVFAVTAQQTACEIRVPQVTKVATIKTDNVNLRQKPTTSSPKLMDSFGDVGYGNFPPGDASPYYLAVGDTYAIIGESGEWIQLSMWEQPWIMKKFCNIQDFSSLNIKAPNFNVAQNNWEYPLMTGTGDYSNLVFEISGSTMMDSDILFVGTAIDNVLYFTEESPFYCFQDENLRPEQIRYNDCTLNFGSKVPVFKKEVDEGVTESCVDFHKLTPKQYAYLVKKMIPKNPKSTNVHFSTTDGKKYQWHFDWTAINFPYKTVKLAGE